MLRTLTADTFEIDSPDDAVADILKQLEPHDLLAHSVGIVSCHPDFITSGAVRDLCGKLPFPVIGATTTATATNTNHGADLLSLMVLTSDTVTFTTALTDPLDTDCAARIRQTCDTTLARGAAPALCLVYSPFLNHFAGVRVVEEMTAATNGVPLFGTIGVDNSANFSNTFVLYNGEAHKDRVAMAFVNGPVNPRFYVIAVSEGNLRKQQGIITDADGSLLKTVNDLSCVEYMASIGLTPNDGLEGVNTLPFIVDYHDGSPPAGRAIFAFTPEGYARCGGEMPVNAGFTVGQLDAPEITSASGQLVRSILTAGESQGLLVISCIGRCLALGLEPYAEMEAVRGVVGDEVPMHMSYSGGEICPVYPDGHKSANRFHNFTLVACVL